MLIIYTIVVKITHLEYQFFIYQLTMVTYVFLNLEVDVLSSSYLLNFLLFDLLNYHNKYKDNYFYIHYKILIYIEKKHRKQSFLPTLGYFTNQFITI